MTRRAIGIIRVSTVGQTGDDKNGVERQRHDIEQAAKSHDLEIVRTVEVVESGSSAFNGEDFKQVFADLARPDVAGVAVSAIDRLVRPGFLGDLAVFDHFQRHKKKIFVPGQEIDVESEAGWLVSGVFGMVGGLEKRAILKRTSGGKERMRANGKHPGGERLLPRGLKYVRERAGDTRKVVKAYWTYTEDAERVRKSYDLLFQGMGFEDIASEVGFATGRGIASILRNTCWKGIRTFPANALRPTPLEIPMNITPLISPERWAKAQAILDAKRTKWRARKRQERTVSLGLGLLRCQCGRFHYLRRDYRPGQHDLFYCGSGYNGRRAGTVSCGAGSIRRTDADAAIMKMIVEFANIKTLRALVEQAVTKPAVKLPSAAKTQREIARITGERERLIDLRITNRITEAQFDARDRKFTGELRDLEALLPKPEIMLDPHALAAALASLFAEFPFLTPEKQHALARQVFVAFDVLPGGDGIVAAVVRGETVAQEYAKFGTRSTSPCLPQRRAPAPRR